jgi:diguanylate cyclase (GGDEF)-like protein
MDSDIKRVLVVEDNPIVLKILKHLVKQELNQSTYEVDYVDSMLGAKELIEENNYFASIADLNLPDSPDGEVVQYLLDRGIPCIVLTANYSEERREKLLVTGIVDYVVKDSRFSFGYAVKLVHRLALNEKIKILVVEDSRTARKYVCDLLLRHQFQIIEADNGIRALALYEEHPDIRLIITDYHMPEMDGFELVREIRGRSDKSDLAIIGLSSVEKSTLSAKFIKNGANDFLQKPFFPEELHCRVIHNLESIELIQALNDAAHKDYLTGLHNRRYMFDSGEALYERAKRGDSPLALAVMDIDAFKHINDTYGHEAGDAVLMFMGKLLREAFSRFLPVRFGGEEFCILLPGLTQAQAHSLMDQFRARIEEEGIYFEDNYLQVTMSIGVTSQLRNSLDEMVKIADEQLHRAKALGRNLVIGDTS